MKKIILLSLMVTVFATSAFSQSTAVEEVFKKYRFGLFLGPTFNSLNATAATDKHTAPNDAIDTYIISKGSGKVGFSFGLNMELNLNEKYTIFSGLGLDWNGGGINVAHDTNAVADATYLKTANIDYKTQYLAIPLGLKMYAFEFSDIKIFAQTGIDLSILLGQKGDFVLTGDSITQPTGTNEKLGDFARVVPVNIGWHIGAGAEYGLSNGSAVYLALLYRNGFSDFTTPKLNKDGNKFADGNIRSNTIAVRVGYFF